MPFILVAIVISVVAGCDEGLSPDPINTTTPGFGGVLTVVSAWPMADSVRDLRIVAFRNYPPKDIIVEVLAGTAIFSEQLKYDSSRQTYRIVGEGMQGNFAYVVAAQQYGDNLFQDWRVVGVFTRSGDVNIPSPVELGSGLYLDDIDIRVDFDNLPPQPF